jgi:dTDP-glucose pyrophosphorylase
VDQLLVGDAAIATFTATSPAHSYVTLDRQGFVDNIAEKQVISSRAVAGVYYFANGAEFSDAARAVLKDERLVLGEYYVSTVLDEMLTRGARISTVHGEVHTLGTPEELEAYHSRGRS